MCTIQNRKRKLKVKHKMNNQTTLLEQAYFYLAKSLFYLNKRTKQTSYSLVTYMQLEHAHIA